MNSSFCIEQSIDERTIRQCAVGALKNHPVEDALHLAEIGDLRPHVSEVGGREIADLGTRPSAILGEPQQGAHLIEREAELAAPADERQPLELAQAATAEPALRPRRSA